jgi:hypothetical protein
LRRPTLRRARRNAQKNWAELGWKDKNAVAERGAAAHLSSRIFLLLFPAGTLVRII